MFLQASGFEPMTFQLMLPCQGITFLTGICMFSIYPFPPIGGHLPVLCSPLENPRAVTKTWPLAITFNEVGVQQLHYNLPLCATLTTNCLISVSKFNWKTILPLLEDSLTGISCPGSFMAALISCAARSWSSWLTCSWCLASRSRTFRAFSLSWSRIN